MMIGLTQTLDILTADIVIVRGVETIDWSNPTEQTVKCFVYYESTGMESRSSGPGLVLAKQLTALMEPIDFETKATRFRWRGDLYTVQPPQIRDYNRKPLFQAVAMSAL